MTETCCAPWGVGVKLSPLTIVAKCRDMARSLVVESLAGAAGPVMQ